MSRFPCLGRWLGLAGVAVWLGSPPSIVRAQVEKSRPGPGIGRSEKGPAEDKGPPRISLLRLQVVRPEPAAPGMPPGFRRNRMGGFEPAPREGTSLTFALDEPDQSIVSVETRDCKIARFRDDRGTDLAPGGNDPPAGGRPRNAPFGAAEGPVSAEVDPAGHRATVTVHSPRLPAGGANRLALEAVLVVRYARGEKNFEQKDVNLKLDKLAAGPNSLVVMSQDEANRGFGQGAGMQVVLFHQGPLHDIKKVAFIGPDGEEITARVSGSGQSGSLHQTHYSLSKRVETCTIRFTAPEAVETVHMAVAVETGIGFPPFVSRRILPAPEGQPAVKGAAGR